MNFNKNPFINVGETKIATNLCKINNDGGSQTIANIRTQMKKAKDNRVLDYNHKNPKKENNNMTPQEKMNNIREIQRYK